MKLRSMTTALLGAAAWTAAQASVALAAQDQCSSRRTITVNGRAEITAEADIAYINFAVETTAATATAAVEKNAQLSNRVAEALKPKIGAGDKLTTSRYSLQPQYDQQPRTGVAERHIVGYTASNEVQIETGKVTAVGELIDAATAAGANRVSNLIFTLRDRDPHARRALVAAGREARLQAEAAAEALGVTLKGVLSATTVSAPILQPRLYEGFARTSMAQAATPVEPGEVTVTADLNVVYEIE